MGNKKGGISFILTLILILLIFVFIYLVYHFYFTKIQPIEVFNNSSELIDNCSPLKDNYILPDFNKLKIVLEGQQIVKDVPASGKINFKFYHFIRDCRKWDKIYLLNNKKITEASVSGDIDLWISSDYASKITSANLCEIIKEAREKGDLGQSVNIGTIKLMWTYNGILKYKDCLGI